MFGPVIMVGCGGSGIMSVRYVREAVRRKLAEHDIREIPEAWQFIGFDALKGQSDLAQVPPLPSKDYRQVTGNFSFIRNLYDVLWASNPPNSPNSGYRELFGWLPDHKQVPGDINLGMGQMRAVGRAAAVHALRTSQIHTRIQAAFDSCQAGSAELITVAHQLQIPIADGGGLAPPLVIVVGSSAGGTGAGIMLDTVDALRRATAQDALPCAVVYEPEIFGANRQAPMVANSIAFMSEFMNALWSTDGGRVGLLPAPLGAAVDRGPFTVFTLGSKNMSGADLENSATVYKAVGDAISSWILSPRVGGHLREYVQANKYGVGSRIGGFGFGGQAVKGGVSSFGSATIAVGRSRFRPYARAFMMRDFYEFHWTGRTKIAEEILPDGRASLGDKVLTGELADHFLPGFVGACGLEQTFHPASGALGPGIAEQILSSDDVKNMGNNYSARLRSSLPESSLDGSAWREEFVGQAKKIHEEFTGRVTGSIDTRLEAWYQACAKRVLIQTNELMTRATLPVAIRVIDKAIEQLNQYPAKYRAALAGLESDKTHAANEMFNLLGATKGSVGKSSTNVMGALEKAGIHQQNIAKIEVVRRLEKVVDSVVKHLLLPTKAAMQRAFEGDLTAVNTMQSNEPSLVSQLPHGRSIPKSFMPSKVEFLLESHEDWPDIFGGLLSECVLRKSGETPIQAFRRELTVGDPAGGGRRPPLLWANDSDVAGWTGSNPLTVKLQIDPQALDEAIERWVNESPKFSSHLSEGLGKFLENDGDVKRLNNFRERLQSALQQAQPLIRVNQSLLQTMCAPLSGNAPAAPHPVIDELPFYVGHPARKIAEDLLRSELGISPTDDLGRFFVDFDKESSVISSFLDKSINPQFSLTFTEAAAEQYLNVGSNSTTLREWFKFKRARTLDEFVPVPRRVYLAMIRGFLVARMLGKMNSDVDNGVKIIDGEKTYVFPHPLLMQVDSRECLPAILEAMPLCFAKVLVQKEDSFAPYRALYRYGTRDDNAAGAEQFRVVGDLANFIDNGRVDGPLIDEARLAVINAETPVDRRDRIVDHIDKWVTQIRNFEVTNPPNGTEMRMEDGTMRMADDSDGVVPYVGLYSLEIIDDISRQFEVVKNAVVDYVRPKGPAGDGWADVIT